MARRPRALRIGAYLSHIVEAIGRNREYASGLSEDGFLQRPMVQDAVIRSHPEFAAEHADIPWRSPYEMRNALSHGYFSVELTWTWTTIKNDLPPFEARIRALLEGIKPA